MRRLSFLPMLLVVALATGCADSPVGGSQDDVTLVVDGPVAVGSAAAVRLVNNSDTPIQIGWLPCYIDTDRRVGDAWAKIPREIGACITPVFTVESGASFPFEFPAPATAGTFRLRTVIGNDQVFSAPFVVR